MSLDAISYFTYVRTASPSNSVHTNPARLNPHANRELKHPRQR